MRTSVGGLVGLLGMAALAACGGDDGGSAPDAGVDAGPGPVDDLGVIAGEPLPAGEWILINEWQSDPNRVRALSPADLGGAARVVFSAPRIWSMGARADGRAIVFSGHDPGREQAFGLTILDSIQNTFAYDTQTGAVTQVAPPGTGWQNVNDECFAPTDDGATVFLCRRYDFTADGAFKGWRLGQLTVATGAFAFVRADDPAGPLELSPQPLPGGRILFELRTRSGSPMASLHVRTLATGEERLVRAQAWRASVAPDGRRVVFADTTNMSRLAMLDLDAPGAAPVPVSPTPGAGDAVWSPDGQTVIYSVYDQPQNCDHLERVTWAGSAWSAPARVRDCAQTGEFITDVAWVTVP